MQRIICSLGLLFLLHACFFCCMHAGSFADPDDIPGLAHFCEHMLFLGTEKVCNNNIMHTVVCYSLRHFLIQGFPFVTFTACSINHYFEYVCRLVLSRMWICVPPELYCDVNVPFEDASCTCCPWGFSPPPPS